MADIRLGDDLDDYCIKCKRVTNHSILALMNGKPAKVRCRTCYHEQDFRDCVVPPSKRELEKAKLFQAVLGNIHSSAAAQPVVEPESAPPKPAKKVAVKRGRK